MNKVTKDRAAYPAALFIGANFVTNRKPNGKTYKQRGEWVEALFLARVAELGLEASKPWGDSAPYDLIVEYKGRCIRVQIKSTSHRGSSGPTCQVRGSHHRAYVDNSFDFAAIYLIEEKVWYIIPTERIAGQVSLSFNPGAKNAKYAHYKEAWHLLREKAEHTLRHVEACAEATLCL